MSLFPSIFCIIAAFSLYGEYVVRSFLPNGVFLRCDHGLDFDISLCDNKKNKKSVVVEKLGAIYITVFFFAVSAACLSYSMKGRTTCSRLGLNR